LPRLEFEGEFPVLLADDGRRELPEIITPDSTSGPAEWGRYHDAVREAARSFDDPQEGDIHHFLRARARNADQVDVPAFHEAVRRQRMADIVDIVDHHMRRDGSLPRGSRMVRTQAPRGYMRRALRNMGSEDLAHVRHRLVAIGHDPSRVDDYLSARANPDMWDQASETEVKFSDEEFGGLTFDDGDLDEFDETIELVSEVMKRIPQPIINVYIDSKEKNENLSSE
jgi:hypothetical protein